MFDQPGPHVRMLVSGVVVADQVDLQTAGNVALDRAQEREELLVPMPGWALADDRAGHPAPRTASSCRLRWLSWVIVAARARGHRQRRLGSVGSLCRRLFVRAQLDRVVRGVEIHTDDVDQLLLEPRVVGRPERVDQVRFQSVRGPDPLHRRGRTPRPSWPSCDTTNASAPPVCWCASTHRPAATLPPAGPLDAVPSGDRANTSNASRCPSSTPRVAPRT